MLAPERWARIRTLLEEVEGLPPAERDAHLDRACAHEPDVRIDVESLLRAGADGDGLLEPPPGLLLDETGAPEPVLAPGTRLDGFEIVAPLGAGGMGRVYRARDTHLGRTVALKVLAPQLADDPASQARFEREARILSNLNHPHICVLHEAGRARLGDQGEVRYLVMELVEGETLASRLARRPLPVDDALEYATQIADALDAAHRQGIVHRDLKPANVVLTKAAGVKLLDFGLARLRPPVDASTPHVVSSTLTQTGLVAGTLPYMSPEQVRGEEADTRSDLFAFGAVLYEMLTGVRPFDAETPTALMAQILERNPPPLEERAPHVPVALDRLIRTCLAKDPADRWQHAHDVVLALRAIRESTVEARTSVPAPAPALSRRWLWAALGAGAVAAGIAIGAWGGRPSEQPRTASRLIAALPLPAGFLPGTSVGFSGQPSISPDGRRVAIIGRWDGRPQVWIRPMDGLTLTPVSGTEDARFVFWAPDSQRIGFIARGALRSVAASGGPVQTLCDVLLGPTSWGRATWGSQGAIIFHDNDGTHSIPESGGTAAPLVLKHGEAGVHYSQASFLPDGRHFLIVVHGAETNAIALASLDGGDVVPLVKEVGAFAPHYTAGHVLFARRGELLALPFDVRTLAATGRPRTVADWPAGGYTASAAGTVVGVPGGHLGSPTSNLPRDIGFRLPDGTRGAALGPSGPYLMLALSADGARAAVVKVNDAALRLRFETWVVNVATTAWTLLDARVGGNQTPTAILDPAWGPDGRRLAFTAHWRGFIRDLSSGADQLIANRPTRYVLDDWTPDGSMILFREAEGVWGTVWGASPGAPDTSRELFRAQSNRDQQQVSPDGRWIAYNAFDSDAWEVYVARFPSFTEVQQVSAARGGVQPIWAHDGERLFYLRFDGMMMGVDLRRDGEVLVADAPRALFTTRLSNPSPQLTEYDVAKDGRFLLMEREPGPYTLTVLTNWAPPGT